MEETKNSNNMQHVTFSKQAIQLQCSSFPSFHSDGSYGTMASSSGEYLQLSQHHIPATVLA
jgi:hypothetical protein